METHRIGDQVPRDVAGDGPRDRKRRGRSRANGVRHDILDDKELILAVYEERGSFLSAGRLCNCSPDYFRRRFIAHGHVPRRGNHAGKVFWAWMMKRAYKKVSRVPDKCPKGCPGWLAEPSCLEPGQDCIFPMRFDKDSNL